MPQLQQKATQKILQLLNTVYQKLSKHPQVSDQQRELLPIQQQLMQNLDPESFHYQSLLRSLAIDSYVSIIGGLNSMSEDLCGMVTVLLEGMVQLGDWFRKGNGSGTGGKDGLEKYNRCFQCLVESVKICQQMYPKSTYITDQNHLLEFTPLQTNLSQQLHQKLRQQNSELRKKCQSSEIQLLNMQNKLTKLLKQHEGCQRTQAMGMGMGGVGVGNKITNIQLREELVLKDAEIQRMNQEFSFEIQKYNTVFQAMRRELEEMKAYQNIDLIEQIQLLETEIVKLRQQRDRDQIIIRQLRNDNTTFTMGGGYYSPRQSSRYHHQHHSRFDY